MAVVAIVIGILLIRRRDNRRLAIADSSVIPSIPPATTTTPPPPPPRLDERPTAAAESGPAVLSGADDMGEAELSLEQGAVEDSVGSAWLALGSRAAYDASVYLLCVNHATNVHEQVRVSVAHAHVHVHACACVCCRCAHACKLMFLWRACVCHVEQTALSCHAFFVLALVTEPFFLSPFFEPLF